MEEDVGPQPEGIDEAIRRYVPGFGQITDDLRVIGRIELEQGRVMRCDRVQKRKRYIGMAVIISGLDEDGKFERSAAFGSRFGETRWKSRTERR